MTIGEKQQSEEGMLERALPVYGWVLRFLSLISSVGLFYLIKQKAPEIESFPWLTGQAQRCTSSELRVASLLKKKKKNPSNVSGL